MTGRTVLAYCGNYHVLAEQISVDGVEAVAFMESISERSNAPRGRWNAAGVATWVLATSERIRDGRLVYCNSCWMEYDLNPDFALKNRKAGRRPIVLTPTPGH